MVLLKQRLLEFLELAVHSGLIHIAGLVEYLHWYFSVNQSITKWLMYIVLLLFP